MLTFSRVFEFPHPVRTDFTNENTRSIGNDSMRLCEALWKDIMKQNRQNVWHREYCGPVVRA